MIEEIVISEGIARELLVTFRHQRKLVGTVSVRVNHELAYGEIKRLFVVYKSRRDGVGRALVNKALEEMANVGAHRAFVDVPYSSDSGGVVRFFESMGFRLMPGTHAGYVLMREIEMSSPVEASNAKAPEDDPEHPNSWEGFPFNMNTEG